MNGAVKEKVDNEYASKVSGGKLAIYKDDEKLDLGNNPKNISEIKYLPLDKIRAREQVRKDFDEDSLKELADSIAKLGVLHPISVYKDGDFYVIISGERRWRASQLAKRKDIPCIIKENMTEKDFLIENLVENFQRDDLNPIEKANGLKNIIDTVSGKHSDYSFPLILEGKLKRKESLTEAETEIITVIKSIGLSFTQAAKYLKLLTLHPDLQKRIISGKKGLRNEHDDELKDDFEYLTISQAYELSRISDMNMQLKVFNKAKGWRFGWYHLHKLVDSLKKGEVDKNTLEPKFGRTPNIRSNQNQLVIDTNKIHDRMKNLLLHRNELDKYDIERFCETVEDLRNKCTDFLKKMKAFSEEKVTNE